MDENIFDSNFINTLIIQGFALELMIQNSQTLINKNSDSKDVAEALLTVIDRHIEALDGSKDLIMPVLDIGKIMELLGKYNKKHPLALVCGAEYIMQNDEAQEDALELVGDIFDILSKENNKETE